MDPRAHSTYPMVRFVPTYGGIPTSVFPVLVIATAILLAVLGLWGALLAAFLTGFVRVAYLWNQDAFAILHTVLRTLPFLDRHCRLMP